MDILIKLRRDRELLGSLMIGEESWPCLAKSDNQAARARKNPQRNPLYSHGDTPTGKYEWAFEKEPWEPRQAYGPYPPIRLLPIDGQALLAARNGRSGFAIHGGRRTEDGTLKPTWGCVRVAEKDMEAIIAHLQQAGVTNGICTIEER